MKAALIALGLLACHIAPAWSETEFQLNCPGRTTMTVSRAEYGLTTLMWPPGHFQIAAGQQRTRLEAAINCCPAAAAKKRDVDALSLERYDDRQHSDT
ncbi:unnamed protein product [Peronospora farinosa]|uniref:Uncharacterized protein n=1 Tax=Peronospora farinosa TaxID=134698 RepID=A0ABN8CEG9_9STRA|nr:unnamed protein product [Peronospora farinosa]